MSEPRRQVWFAEIRGAALFGTAGRKAWVSMTVGQPLLLEREPLNPADSSAIKVSDLMGQPVGYVAREVSCKIAPVMDAGKMVLARITRPVVLRTKSFPVAKLWIEGNVEGKTISQGTLLAPSDDDGLEPTKDQHHRRLIDA